MRNVALLLLLAIVTALHAQTDDEYRMEVGAGVGAGNYQGDFNGNLAKELQPRMAALLRYNLNPYMALRLTGTFGKLKGSSAHAGTYYPGYATMPYAFDRSMTDVSVMYEYNFWPYGTGRDYRGARRLTPYVTGGLGLTSVWGDGSNTAVNVPLGLGLKYKLGQRTNLGVEWIVHFGTSDKLDGVKDPYGVKSSGLFKNADSHSTLLLTLSYSFMPRCTTCNKE